MTTYTWPSHWVPSRFEMAVMPNVRTYQSTFNPSSLQVVDVGGDYWTAVVVLPPGISLENGAATEAIIARLRGPLHSLSLYHRRRPQPLGTMRDGSAATWTTASAATATWTTASAATATWTAGDPANKTAIAQFATTTTLTMTPGKTLKAGDLIGLANGQTVMNLVDATANGSGDMSIEFAPSARSAIAAYGHVTWDRPTVNFRLREGGPVPVMWSPGVYDGITLDLVEAT